MSWYRLFVRGQDFPVFLDGNWAVQGFYTTRYVEASSEEEARDKTLTMLRRDASLALPDDAPGRSNAKVFFEEVDSVDGPGRVNSGFSFFADPGYSFFE